VVVLEIFDTLKEDTRQNLRVMANFDSFIYPITGKWKGRTRVIAHDLSCGGIAFFCDYPLEDGEEFEVVIPITEHPVILHAQVIRHRLSKSKIPLYAAKFLNMVDDEEAFVREAVFGLQIQNHNKHRETASTSFNL
jgi:c-di-GMP-binding flagellar brake protein YcgR